MPWARKLAKRVQMARRDRAMAKEREIQDASTINANSLFLP
jgi:hypothetical protein